MGEESRVCRKPPASYFVVTGKYTSTENQLVEVTSEGQRDSGMSLFHSWRLDIWVFLICPVPVSASFYIQRRNSEGKRLWLFAFTCQLPKPIPELVWLALQRYRDKQGLNKQKENLPVHPLARQAMWAPANQFPSLRQYRMSFQRNVTYYHGGDLSEGEEQKMGARCSSKKLGTLRDWGFLKPFWQEHALASLSWMEVILITLGC